MRFALVLFAVGASAGAGYLVGDEGEVTMSALAVAGAVGLALLLFAIVPQSRKPERVSLRPGTSTPRATGAAPRRVLHPGEAARLREQERVLATGRPVAMRLVDTGRNQIAVIKVLRNYLDIGLKEAKDLSDAAKKGASPLVVAAMAVERAREFATDIENAGGHAEFEEGPTRS